MHPADLPARDVWLLAVAWPGEAAGAWGQAVGRPQLVLPLRQQLLAYAAC